MARLRFFPFLHTFQTSASLGCQASFPLDGGATTAAVRVLLPLSRLDYLSLFLFVPEATPVVRGPTCARAIAATRAAVFFGAKKKRLFLLCRDLNVSCHTLQFALQKQFCFVVRSLLVLVAVVP